jgi:hypothetical protein
MPTHTKDADVVDDDRTKSIIPHNLRLRAARTHAPRAPAQLQDHRRLPRGQRVPQAPLLLQDRRRQPRQPRVPHAPLLAQLLHALRRVANNSVDLTQHGRRQHAQLLHALRRVANNSVDLTQHGRRQQAQLLHALRRVANNSVDLTRHRRTATSSTTARPPPHFQLGHRYMSSRSIEYGPVLRLRGRHAPPCN